MSDLQIDNNKLTVKAVTYENGSTPLITSNIDIPVIPETIVKPTEVLVKVKGVALNPVDCILKNLSNNWFGPKTKIIGGDFSGIVVKAGSDSGFSENDKIYGDILHLRNRGSASEYILFEPKKALICEKIPEGMSFIEAASLPCVSNTGFETLKVYKGDSLKGKNVLVLGAGTSVGSFAVQFAKKYFEAGLVAATCSSKSTEKTKKFGADITIDYTKGDEYKIKEFKSIVSTKGKFDIIVDCVRDECVIENFDELLKPGSENGVYSQVAGSYVIDYKKAGIYDMIPSWKYQFNQLKYKLGLFKYDIKTIWTQPDPTYGPAIAKLWNEKKLHIVIDSTYDAYTDSNTAFDRVATCSAKGKVVLTF